MYRKVKQAKQKYSQTAFRDNTKTCNRISIEVQKRYQRTKHWRVNDQHKIQNPMPKESSRGTTSQNLPQKKEKLHTETIHSKSLARKTSHPNKNGTGLTLALTITIQSYDKAKSEPYPKQPNQIKAIAEAIGSENERSDLRRSQDAGMVERMLLEESLLHQSLLLLLLQPLVLHFPRRFTEKIDKFSEKVWALRLGFEQRERREGLGENEEERELWREGLREEKRKMKNGFWGVKYRINRSY